MLQESKPASKRKLKKKIDILLKREKKGIEKLVKGERERGVRREIESSKVYGEK